MMQRVGLYCWRFQCSDRSTCTSDRTQSRWTGSISSKLAFKGHVCSDIISSFYSFDASVSSDGNSYFFKKLKHKRKLEKLQTDLATAKQEAAITVLELNEKIKTLCEGKPAPRGQYYHVTVTHWPLALGDAYSFSGNKAESKATVPGSVLGQQCAGLARPPFCMIRDSTQTPNSRLGVISPCERQGMNKQFLKEESLRLKRGLKHVWEVSCWVAVREEQGPRRRPEAPRDGALKWGKERGLPKSVDGPIDWLRWAWGRKGICVFFFFFLTSLLKYNCLTMVC